MLHTNYDLCEGTRQSHWNLFVKLEQVKFNRILYYLYIPIRFLEFCRHPQASHGITFDYQQL